MARARPIPGLEVDDAYAEVAVRVVAVRAEELASHAEGVLDLSEIERLHDMRVATRRLRAALEVFEPCFPRKRFRAALSEVKALADALGRRRDRDVAIVALRRFERAAGAAEAPGVRSLTESVRAEQVLANEALEPLLAPERLEALQRRLGELADEAEARVAPGPPATAAGRAPSLAGAADGSSR